MHIHGIGFVNIFKLDLYYSNDKYIIDEENIVNTHTHTHINLFLSTALKLILSVMCDEGYPTHTHSHTPEVKLN